MTDGAQSAATIRLGDLRYEDLRDVIRIDALHTGERKPEYWRSVFGQFLRPNDERPRVGLAARDPNGVVGYLLGEVRAFEFGSEACGWIFGVGVDPDHARTHVGSRLLAEACRRFHEAGVDQVRTMVLKNNVPVLSFFRANGFVAGSFVQLELDLEG